MRLIYIPKKNGRRRTVAALKKNDAQRFRALCHELNIVSAARALPCAHGFIIGRNAVTAAIPHVGYDFTLSADLSDFFDSVTPEMYDAIKRTLRPVKTLASYDVPTFGNSYIEKHPAAQGLPSSPMIANLAAVGMDRDLSEWCEANSVVYTRYADDLSFSSNDKAVLLRLRELLPAMVQQHGFALNNRKTRLQWGGNDGSWTREVVGVGVNRTGLVPLRHSRRRLRAAEHRVTRDNTKHNRRVAAGLREWHKLKPARRANYCDRARATLTTRAITDNEIVNY
jgi:hypothetical protein